jgi:hypothetical protein
MMEGQICSNSFARSVRLTMVEKEEKSGPEGGERETGRNAEPPSNKRVSSDTNSPNGLINSLHVDSSAYGVA